MRPGSSASELPLADGVDKPLPDDDQDAVLRGKQRPDVTSGLGVRAEAAYPALVAFLLGDTGEPFVSAR